MMEVKDLTARTRKGKLLLDHVSFTLEPGGCTGLTGASGSGKTTLLKALLGVSDSDVAICGGQFLLDGKDLLQQTEKVRRELCGTTLGFIPQNPMTAFNLHVSVGAQMAETFRKRLHIEKRAAQKLSMEALKKVHLTDSERVYRAYPGQLSGGMLQRVTMAILLGLSPRYIFADEPTSALDEDNKSYLTQELARMKQQCAAGSGKARRVKFTIDVRRIIFSFPVIIRANFKDAPEEPAVLTRFIGEDAAAYCVGDVLM